MAEGNAGGAINTFVEGDSGSCRETAAWLGKMSAGCHDIGTGIHRARSEWESIWQGDAGEEFREEMGRNGADADELTEYFNRGKIALNTFADDLDTVRAKMRQAREVATQHGLNVTPTTIEHPGPEPAKMPSNGPGPDTTERTPGEEQAIADYQAKVQAFNEAHATVKDARRKEDSAHQSLKSALKMTKSLPEALVPQGWAWAPVVTGAYSGAYGTAKALNKIADNAQRNADSAKALLDKPGLSATDRQQALRGYLDSESKARPASTAAQSAQRLDDMIPGSPKLKEGLSTSIKGAGVVGLVTTGASVYQDIQKGVPADKAATKGATSTAASAGVGAGMTALAGAGYIGGVAATGGTLLVGTVVAAGVGWAVDNYYDDVKNWFTD